MKLRHLLGIPDDCSLTPCWSGDGELLFEMVSDNHYGVYPSWMIMSRTKSVVCQMLLDWYLESQDAL